MLAASYIPQELCGQLTYLIQIFTVDANSQSEVEIGQFGREGQKQRSFGVKLTGEGGCSGRGRGVKSGEGAAKLKLSSLIPNLRSKLVNSVGKVKNKGVLVKNQNLTRGSKLYQNCSIFDADSESEVEIGQFDRKVRKPRSFGLKNMVFGVKMGQND